MFKKENRFIKKFDFLLLLTTFVLVFFGLVIIKSSTMSYASGSYRYLRTQTLAFVLGSIVVIVLLLIDYEIYGYFYIPIYVISNILLIAVILFGHGAAEWGASNWLKIGPISFQPSEIAKFGIIISLAKFIDKNKEKINEPFILIKILAFAFLPVALILLQPDLGTALVFVFFIIIMIFSAGLSYKYIWPFVLLGIILLIAGVIFLNFYVDDYIIGDNYMLDRIMMFLYPEMDPSGKGYQVIQSKIAIGSGEMFGRGLFLGVQNQYGFLPTKETDFIFAVVCEELGFVGGIALIMLYALLLLRLIKIAKTAKDTFGSLIVIGIMGMFLFHILENIGMTMGLMPVTGIPLPFVSYGGTFMLMNMFSIGLVLQVGLHRGKQDLYN
ncbi:rod shape-determining protein RodA [Sedimentibacter sp. zth1]|uniref:rod shape-determining protein RodA n=1 Tax=Sedimentibacter sp. zth1 TaxID=2816908 RepID=UPI001A92FA69|nr:rod shape-determining protein RodA [Sedimentibacter sp. zth1]QSX06349.1 rod shape-determining protein RodA [Sedimentibacter sp. zth1]